MADLVAESMQMPPTPGPREERIAIGHDDGSAGEPAEAQVSGLATAAEPGQHMSKRRAAVATGAVMLGVAACWVLAGMVAERVGGSEEVASVAADGPSEYPARLPAGVGGLEERASWRRLGAETVERAPGACHTAKLGEPCYRHVMWAMRNGLHGQGHAKHTGLTANSTFEDFQEALHTDPWASCPRPCHEGAAKEEEVHALSGAGLGWQPSGRVVAQGQWCSGREPFSGWALHSCGSGKPLQVKVLTYNLFWWNLFGRRGGNGGSAGRLIAGASQAQKFDIMAFQECEGVGWVLGDAGLTGEFAALTGPHALCIAYRRSAWNLLADSSENVAEDRADQWYGTRAAMWARVQHTETSQVVFFINHHGPLPVQSGGRCGGEATAFNILELIAAQAREGDLVVLTGDFNAGPDSETLKSLGPHMHKAYTGTSFGGVDHVLSSCQNVAASRNLGSGGSDHDAIEVTFQL